MIDTLTRYLEGMKNARISHALRGPLQTLVDRYSSQPLTSAGLVIHGSASALAKTGAADFYAIANGTLVKIAASTDLPALTGINITAANFNVVCFFIDSGGTVTIAAGTQGATVGAVLFPPFPKGKALVGFLLITNASTFTGGTTALDAATTVYVNGAGPFDPSALV
jgi:hypothetical protein